MQQPFAGYTSQIHLLVVFNAFTQFLCIAGVHKLSSVSNSLTGKCITFFTCTYHLLVNLALTLRKFISLILSVYFFHEKFETGHVVGTLLVFTGTVCYYTFAKRTVGGRGASGGASRKGSRRLLPINRSKTG